MGLIGAVAAAAIVLVLTVGRHPSTTARRSTGAPSNSTAATSVAVALSDARALVVRYLDDVNAQNRSDAQSLICASLADTWHTSIDQQGGDFTFRVSKATFTAYHPTTDGITLDYALDVAPAVDASGSTGSTGSTVTPTTNQVTFTVVRDLGGLRICGES